jgi:hypothetical protein
MEELPRRLTNLPTTIVEHGYELPAPYDHRMTRDKAINREIPAHQRNGIWHFYPRDIPAIAQALRLKKAAVAADIRQERKTRCA